MHDRDAWIESRAAERAERAGKDLDSLTVAEYQDFLEQAMLDYYDNIAARADMLLELQLEGQMLEEKQREQNE